MTRHIRHAALFCALLLVALLVNAARVQVLHAEDYETNPANRRATIVRYQQPRGDILVDGRPVTGSRDTGEHLRYERTYRDGPLYAPVTGFASQEYGTTLLEATEDAVLSGAAPVLQPLPLWNEFTRSRSAGGDVLTTIDPRAQRAAYEGLRGRKGAVAAVEPSTGRILALVSVPSYDPEPLSGNGRTARETWARLNADPDRPMLNRAVQRTYPPGSTFKVVTAAAALDAGVVKGVDRPTRSPDPYLLPGTTTRLVNGAKECRNATLRDAFVRSCNTVFAQLGVTTGVSRMRRAAESFGFNDADLRIPFPVAPSTFDTTVDAAQLALSSIGQYNTRATPLQMAMVAAAVASGGQVREPYLVERTTRASGGTVSAAGSGAVRRAMLPATASRLRELMRGVVEDGTGGKAAIPGAVVGGKTGTAQHGLGNSGMPYAWFISWAQREDEMEPRVAVAVVVEDGEGSRREISGGGTAAPVARAVMEAVLRHE
ncbi:penicillin-binding protein 2 [Streptomyces cellulosae]|uniref:Penicillin-binding protein 2 n=2 Tax=Streptomyces TaxID=1883 RepID=A0ABU3J1N1_9ACTN|nr:penicillin-binding protein 2 [Streptomyces sp. McG7]MDQ0485910.1 peptidoglycan glycosyltransferase [Streptomyces thermodiastaticus]MDT6968971.1 penicillin-binding protein 2 [Streptomyces thermocarboxydus]MDX3418304.1 penicillin-binding protein 2 [Streptomyces sp. MD20-1-1]MYQ30944.1 penicillin-binding protein 2 [Streptomyces sp. SID4956]MYW51268.1 penicillin-binding protein 2 [Streptomyces sp. SID8376]THC53671.1 penicillin-binding protein 2 [Streptomyces sp. Akac8]WSB43533.1 penicillin-bi